MGESIVQKPSVEKEMSDLDRAVTPLEVSVSFGRFENDDSLSWEKWSSFSPNKYLEEVGKYSTPGSVAQKKAYFEAHYKKIAAQKAEQLDQEKPLASPPTPTRDESEKKSHVKHTYVADEELELSSNGRSGEDLDPEETAIESAPVRLDKTDNTSQIKHTPVADGEYDVLSDGRSGEYLDQDISRNWTVNPASFDGGKEDAAAIAEDRKDWSVEEVEEKLNGVPDNIESNDKDEAKEEFIQIEADFHLNAREETANIQAETSQKILQESVVEQSSQDVAANETLVQKKKSMKVPARSTAQKMTPPKKELYPPEAKKKVAASPVRKSLTTTKFSQVSTPGLSKSTIMPASQPSTKKASRASFPKSNFTSPGEHRRAVPSSLHMSMSLDTAKPLASVMPIRKSLIMEQMGDKDIVRRAFKTFQKQLNGVASSNNGMFNGQQQMSVTDSEQKVTRALIPQKENERLRRSAEKTNRRGDLGNRSNHSSSVLHLHKGPGAERKKPTAESPSSTRLRSDARYEKQKQVEKDAQLKKAKQGLNFKATLTPPYNRADIKIPSQKEDNVNNNKSHHQSTSDSKGQ